MEQLVDNQLVKGKMENEQKVTTMLEYKRVEIKKGCVKIVKSSIWTLLSDLIKI